MLVVAHTHTHTQAGKKKQVTNQNNLMFENCVLEQKYALQMTTVDVTCVSTGK